jgi:hypothetical protein
MKSMNIVVHHFMTAFNSRPDIDKDPIISRDDFNRLFSNAKAIRDASAKYVCYLIFHLKISYVLSCRVLKTICCR